MFYFRNFVKPNGCVRYVKFFFHVTVLISRFCLLGIDDFHVIFTIHLLVTILLIAKIAGLTFAAKNKNKGMSEIIF
jgi:hypothetical protein